MNKVTTPHDKLAKRLLGNPQHAAAFLQDALPIRVADRLDLSAVEVVPGSFVDPDLAERHTDLLFRVPLVDGGHTFVFALLEHQSTPDPLMPLRVLVYMVRIWEKFISDLPDARKVPAIVPLVLYHGAQPWPGPDSFTELIELPEDLLEELRVHLPAFTLRLEDLSDIPDEELKSKALVGLMKLAMKHYRDPDFLAQLGDWSATWDQAFQVAGFDAVVIVLRYVIGVSEEVTAAQLKALVAAKLSPKVSEMLMTLEARILNEGRQQGLHEGRQQGQKDALVTLLGQRFGPIPASAVLRVEHADADEVAHWLANLMTANSLKDLLGPTE